MDNDSILISRQALQNLNESELNDRITALRDWLILRLKKTGRKKVDKLISCLDASSFFSDPASAYYHNAFKGGLLFHCCNIIVIAERLKKAMSLNVPGDSIILTAVIHDLSKVGTYKIDSKRMQDKKYKDDKNRGYGWQTVACYSHVSVEPDLGHGPTSLYRVMKKIGSDFLRKEEEVAIVYHMGLWDESMKRKFGELMKKNPLLLLLHTADTWSGAFYESDGVIEHLVF